MIEIENPSPGDAFEADLKAYLDGELPLLRRLQVRAHLARCSKCQEELKIMQVIEAELKEEVTAPLGADLRAHILKNAPLEAPHSNLSALKAPAKISTRHKRQFVLGVVAAGLAVMVLAPTFSRSRENARRSAISSTLKPMPPSFAPNAAISADEALPSAAPGDASAAVSAARPVDQMVAGQKNVRVPVYSDGHVKNYVRNGSAGVSGDSSNGLSGYGTGIYLDNKQNGRAVHKEGSLTVAVTDAEKSGAEAERIVKNAGGFVATNSLSTGAGEQRSATLDCRIPVEKFELVVQKVAGLGTVRAKNLNGEDITARVAAAAARKSTLSNEFSIATAQLRQKEKSKKKSDAQSLYYARLEVRNLRLQAAQARAQLETLRRFSDLSSLYLTVQDKPKVSPVAGPTSELGYTAREAWKSFLVSARLPLQLFIWILAYSPLWVPMLIVWKKWGRNWLSAA